MIIIKVILLVLLALLVLLMLWPVSFYGSVLFSEGKFRLHLVFFPVCKIKGIAFTIKDINISKDDVLKKISDKSPGRVEENKSESEDNIDADSEDSKTEDHFISEFILDIIALLGKVKKRLKLLHLTLLLGYGLKDPALTGRITGVAYETIPILVGNPKSCRCCIRLYPQWCPKSPGIDIRMNLTCNILGLIVIFGPLLPGVLKLKPNF